MRATDSHIGLAPRAAILGDQVCIVMGCRQLLLLRSVNGNQYMVIGECYLCDHSLVEALLGPLPPGFRTLRTYNDHKIFEDAGSGERTRKDPRVEDLGVDLATYWEQLETTARSYLDVDVEELNEHLVGRGVHTQTIDLI
jgi:hypothetical protein